jgi:hypothetical protein
MKKIKLKAVRDQQKLQGFFDGRFRPKQVKDKKKEKSKKMCRGSIKKDPLSFLK